VVTVLAIMFLAYLMASTGIALIIDAWVRHRRVDPADRPSSSRPSLADEAEVWLSRQD